MNRDTVLVTICVTIVLLSLNLTVWALNRTDAQAETRRVEYCMRFAPYATLDELTACLTQARG